ncbi:MAG: hypothetical protein GY926_00200 [bacterium]|nr:hypothetical protein [bacterium]
MNRGRLVVVDYAVDSYATGSSREWLRTYSEHGEAGPALHQPGTKDITADIDVSAVSAIRPPDRIERQRTWLRRHGIDSLVDEGRVHWAAHRATPDLVAIEMHSRVSEAEALLDAAGLGQFTVLEWAVGLPA